MLYMLLLYAKETAWDALGEAGQAAALRQHAELEDELVKAGKFKTCNALERTRSATTVQVRSAKTLVTDGPFAETKEQLGGYYIVNAQDLDEAIAIAARIPDASVGSVEIRPIHVFD